jgi:hypothetical protein
MANYECSYEGTSSQNIRNSSTRSHPSEEENCTRIAANIASINGPLEWNWIKWSHIIILLHVVQIRWRDFTLGKSTQGIRGNFTPYRPITTQENFPRTENFPKISLLKVEHFQLQNFFSDGKFVSANHILQKFYFCVKFSWLEMGFNRGGKNRRAGKHCSQEMLNSCRKFVRMKICYWKFEGNLNAHVPLWAQQHMVDRHYSLNLKPWSEHYMFMHMQMYHKDTPLVCRKFLSPGCTPRKKILFSCPAPYGGRFITSVWFKDVFCM